MTLCVLMMLCRQRLRSAVCSIFSHGATLVSPVARDGLPQWCSADEDGAALAPRLRFANRRPTRSCYATVPSTLSVREVGGSFATVFARTGYGSAGSCETPRPLDAVVGRCPASHSFGCLSDSPVQSADSLFVLSD